MENKAHALMAGVFVLAVSALLALLAIWLTRDTTERHFYELTTSETVSGLQPQALVRYRGVPVGKIDAIGFDTKVAGNVLIRIAVDTNAPLTTATFATVASQGITGLGFIQLDDEDRQPGQAAAARLQPNDSDPPRIPLKPGFLDKLARQSELIVDQVEQASKRLNQLLSDGNQQALVGAVKQMGEAAGNLNQLALRLDTTVTKKLDPALTSFSQATRDVSQAASSMGQVADRLGEKDGALDKLAQGTDALTRSAQNFNSVTLPRINRVTDDVARSARQASRAANQLGDNPRSLIFGSTPAAPGPGEPGFSAPTAGQ